MMYSKLLESKTERDRSPRLEKLRLAARFKKIPAKFRENTLMDKPAKEFLRSMKKHGLYLHGMAGSGKTTLATAMLKACWYKQIPGKFIDFQDWSLTLLGSMDRSVFLIKELKETPGLLVLDDMFFGNISDHMLKVCFVVLNYRESNNLPTVITSNLTVDEVEQKTDSRISSRIRGLCKVVGINKADYRDSK